MEKIFEKAYRENWWEKGSGPGSYPENTTEYRTFLEDFIKKNSIKSVLDAGCGDWHFSKLINWNGANYVGIDVVSFLIEENTKKYSKENIKFYKKDILKDELPEAELIILKDVLQHLSNENILKFLPKLNKFKFALLINGSCEKNIDCENGGYRAINLKKPPFNLAGEEFFLLENSHFKQKQILLVRNNRIESNRKNCGRIRIGINAPRNGKTNVLYVYDKPDWAIHKVGRLWLENNPLIEATYKTYSEIEESEFTEYDLIWFGYFRMIKGSISNFDKCIVSVHDPLELFPQVKNWKSRLSLLSLEGLKWLKERRRRIKILKKAGRVVVASKEMQNILQKYGVPAYFIPTMGSFEPKNKEEIKTEKCSIVSICKESPRKNVGLLKELKEYCEKNLKVNFDLKISDEILPETDYLKILDSHEIYVCASFQEGGPIPAMEAMTRGAAVLTTRVGQMAEIITDGENGFFCDNKQDFIEKIKMLSGNLKLLHSMRLKSRESILEKRNEEKIKSAAYNLVKSFS